MAARDISTNTGNASLSTVASGTVKTAGNGDVTAGSAAANVAVSVVHSIADAMHDARSEGTYAIGLNPEVNTMCDVNVDDPGSYTLIIGNGDGKGAAYWTLPIPMQLNYNSEYQWKDEDLNVSDFGVYEMLGDAAGAMPKYLKMFNNSLFSGGKIDNASSFNSYLKNNLHKVGNEGIDKVTKEASRAAGAIKNPNKNLYFTGLDLRKFTLSFSLAPTSKQEADNIKSGFQKLTNIAAPSYALGTSFFTYPEMVGVEVKLNGVPVLKRGALVITSITLDFTSDGPLTYHDDGMPTAMQLNIEFQETVVPTRENLHNVTVMGVNLGSGKVHSLFGDLKELGKKMGENIVDNVKFNSNDQNLKDVNAQVQAENNSKTHPSVNTTDIQQATQNAVDERLGG